MDLHDIRKELINKVFMGVVESITDEKRRGRVRIRVERLHGKLNSGDFIPTEDLPWATPNLTNVGSSFGIPPIGKVLYVTFVDGDWYRPVFSSAEHYNINLQQKLQDLSEEEYIAFGAGNFDNKHQYYADLNKGLVFDYLKSNINFRNNGDIRINLRDNSSKLYLGTEDATQQAMLGNHFITWMDKFINNLIGAYGGPYLGNLTAPIIPHPKMIEVLNEFKAIKETFLSDHVFITDDKRIVAQDRGYDNPQSRDNYNDETQQRVETVEQTGYVTEQRKPSNEVSLESVPTSDADANILSSKIPSDATFEEKARLQRPFDSEIKNGEIPLESMTVSKELVKTFSGSNDERKYLLDSAAKSLDSMISAYRKEKKSNWNNILVVKGYQNIERQTNIRSKNPSIASIPGLDPFGWGNQVELFWGIEKRDVSLTNELKIYIKSGILPTNTIPKPETEVLDWLYKNSTKYGWKNVGRTNMGENQWWHWIYIG